MSNILIVDDDPPILRGLKRAIDAIGNDHSVLTAAHGGDAQDILGSGEADFVITDLQMPKVDGFQLLAWMQKHTPHVPALVMTAFGTADNRDRLRNLGSTECLPKPVDPELLLGEIDRLLAQRISGHVENIGLASFLQLIEMEQKTCTLRVSSGSQSGQLWLRMGKLLGAQAADLRDEEAVLEIITWDRQSIEISNACGLMGSRIKQPLGFLLMEGMRLRDERRRAAEAPAEELLVESLPPPPSTELEAGSPSIPPPSKWRFSIDILKSIPGSEDVVAALLIEHASGRVVASAVRQPSEAVTAVGAAAARAIKAQIGISDSIGCSPEDIVSISDTFYVVSRRINALPDLCVTLLLDRASGTPALARYRAEAIERAVVGDK